MKLGGKTVHLPLLQEQLAAAGVPVPALGTDGDDLHTYTAGGEIADLPAAAAAVVAAHESPPHPREAALAALRASEDPAIRHVLTLLGLA